MAALDVDGWKLENAEQRHTKFRLPVTSAQMQATSQIDVLPLPRGMANANNRLFDPLDDLQLVARQLADAEFGTSWLTPSAGHEPIPWSGW